jgi:hypothetical protein
MKVRGFEITMCEYVLATITGILQVGGGWNSQKTSLSDVKGQFSIWKMRCR